MNKLLIISGPTATGKTDLAVQIAQKFNGELVSGDSCQIYKGMDIGTGKDQPDETPIHLIDLINPDQKFSVAEFKDIALKTIKEIQSRNKLPILVGCSGFYIDAIVNPNYDTFSIKPNKFLRFILNKLSVKTLQKIYKFLDKKSFEKLNNSDINNPHRLIRKIEITKNKLSKKIFFPFVKGRWSEISDQRDLESRKENFDTLHISLTAPLSFLYDRINKRVDKRIKIGFLDEIKKLLKKYSWNDPGFEIAAYQCLKPYFQNKTEDVLKDCLQKWKFAEHSDARRQGTYFRSKKNIYFYDITSKNIFKKIFGQISKWYTKSKI